MEIWTGNKNIENAIEKADMPEEKEIFIKTSTLLKNKRIICSLAFVDTGAGYCVLHPKFIDVLKLKPEREEGLQRFGRKEPVKTEIASLEIEVNGFRYAQL